MTDASSLNALGNVGYLAPGEPEPNAAKWDYRKTNKKGNRVYVRKPVTLEMVRKLTREQFEALETTLGQNGRGTICFFKPSESWFTSTGFYMPITLPQDWTHVALYIILNERRKVT